MANSWLQNLFNKKREESLVSVDIGTSSIKLMELDLSGERPRLKNAGVAPTPAGAVRNNMIVKPDEVAAVIRSVLDANGIVAERAITAVPGPAVFTKKITLATAPLKELRDNINFEASNYIPHSIDAVHLDFQVLKSNGGNSVDVLLVAVKNEIVGSYLETLTLAGLEPEIVDIDYFALENMFETNYPEEKSKTIALVNIGSRYTGISILQGGDSLFSGDVAVGGRLYTDALCEALSLRPSEAEQAKLGVIPEGVDKNLVIESIDRTTEHVASEIQRQLSFFWNAAATDRAIEGVYVCGGGSQTPGLVEELRTKTGIPCTAIDCFRSIDISEGFDADYLAEIAPSMAVSVGLAARRNGDKVHVMD